MDHTHLLALLRLNAVEGIGPKRIKDLLARFGHGQKIFEASLEDLTQVAGISTKQAGLIRQSDPDLAQHEWDRCEKFGIKVLALGDPQYPALLQEIHDPPPLLYVKGQTDLSSKNTVALVGTRSCTPYGSSQARKMAYALAAHNFVVVSGLAQGVDTAAHLGALDAGGHTWAVLGCGMLAIDQKQKSTYARKIAEQGAVISEFPLYQKANKGTFPRRNRIIAGLSLGTLVIEAPEKSGALITTDFAMEEGREVFALPGAVDNPMATGCNKLIQQGAKLVTHIDDILHEFDAENCAPAKVTAPANLTQEESTIMEALTGHTVHVDDLSDATGLELNTLTATLTMLEIKGLVQKQTGGTFTTAH